VLADLHLKVPKASFWPDGAIRLGQEHVAQFDWRTGPADQGTVSIDGERWTSFRIGSWQRGGAAYWICLPTLQPAAGAHGGAQRRASTLVNAFVQR